MEGPDTPPQSASDDLKQRFATRRFFRVAGPSVVAIGFGFFLLGIIGAFVGVGGSFLSTLGLMGMPILFVGLVVTGLTYTGPGAKRYKAEVAGTEIESDSFADDWDSRIVEYDDPSPAASTTPDEDEATAKLKRNMIKCPRCGEQTRRASLFCDACGAWTKRTKACPTCHTKNYADQRFCEKCNRHLDA